MIRPGKWTLTAVFCLTATTLSQAQVNAIDVCYSMAQNALHDITVSQTNDAAVAALYSNDCYADGSSNDGAINSSGSAIVEGLPISAAFSGKDKTTRFKQFCSQYQSSSAVTNNQYNYSNMVLSKGLTSVNECVRAAGSNFSLSYKTITPSTMVINFTIPAGQSLTINGIKPDAGVKCTGHNFHSAAGGVISYDQGTKQTIDSRVADNSITCVRDPSGTAGANQFYGDKAVIVTTTAGSLDIFWPQDSVFPIVTASTIQNNIIALQTQINTNKAEVEFNLLPLGSIIPWYSNAGAPPSGWVKCDGSDPAHCPNLNTKFLMGTTTGSVGATGGNASVPAPQFGSNNRTPNGNGWSVDGNHYSSTDPLTITTIPPYVAVLYIMKIANS